MSAQVDHHVFFHSHAQLKAKLWDLEKADDPRDQDMVAGVQAALRFIDEDLSGTIHDYNALIDQQQITYEYLWALFRPNVYVYGHHDATDQPFVAHARKLKHGRSQSGELYTDVECDIIVHDYYEFGLAPYSFRISQFSGARPIHELSAYPLEYHRDHEALSRAAVERGKLYAGLRLHCYSHHGIATVHVDPKTKLKLTVSSMR